jgi:hypothetical protein
MPSMKMRCAPIASAVSISQDHIALGDASPQDVVEAGNARLDQSLPPYFPPFLTLLGILPYYLETLLGVGEEALGRLECLPVGAIRP